MRRSLVAAAVAAVVVVPAVLISGAVAGADSTRRDGDGAGDEVTLEFDVRTSPFSYTDLGKPGPSAADVIVFHDELLEDGREVGRQVGSCVVVDPSGLSNCSGVVTLDGRGTISFAFENAPPPRKTLSVTGGSDDFRSAGGEGVFEEAGNDTATMTLTLDVP